MEKKNILGWEELLSKQPEAYKKWFGEEKKYLITNIKPNSKVLEVGCGDGRSLRDVSEVTNDITGVDHDETAIEHATIKLKDLNCKLVLADGKKLPFKDKTFDYVTCIGTFANFGKDKYNALNEMKRVLKDNGKIIISVYSEDALGERMKMYKKIAPEYIKEVKKNGTVIFREFGKDNVSEQFSQKRLTSIFKKSQLKVEDIKKVGIGYLCKLTK